MRDCANSLNSAYYRFLCFFRKGKLYKKLINLSISFSIRLIGCFFKISFTSAWVRTRLNTSPIFLLILFFSLSVNKFMISFVLILPGYCSSSSITLILSGFFLNDFLGERLPLFFGDPLINFCGDFRGDLWTEQLSMDYKRRVLGDRGSSSIFTSIFMGELLTGSTGSVYVRCLLSPWISSIVLVDPIVVFYVLKTLISSPYDAIFCSAFSRGFGESVCE